jgi:hypothetical protein
LERRIEKIEEGEEKKRENLAEIIDANSYWLPSSHLYVF